MNQLNAALWGGAGLLSRPVVLGQLLLGAGLVFCWRLLWPQPIWRRRASENYPAVVQAGPRVLKPASLSAVFSTAAVVFLWVGQP